MSFTRGGAWLLPLERSVPCYFNPLWDDLFNKCLSLFSCRPLWEQTEHVFCFPQIKESIREGATEKEREITGPYMDLYYVDPPPAPFFFLLPCRRCKMHSASIKYILDLWEKYKWNINTLKNNKITQQCSGWQYDRNSLDKSLIWSLCLRHGWGGEEARAHIFKMHWWSIRFHFHSKLQHFRLNSFTSSLWVSSMETFSNTLNYEQAPGSPGFLLTISNRPLLVVLGFYFFFFFKQLTLYIDPTAALWLPRRMCQTAKTLFASKGPT